MKRSFFLRYLPLPLSYHCIYTAFTLDLRMYREDKTYEIAIPKIKRETKYLFYYSHSGFSNQLFGLANAAQLAYHTNRTLILPPLLEHHVRIAGPGCAPYAKSLEFIEIAKLDAKICQDNPSKHESFAEILDIEKISHQTGVQLIDLKDFIRIEPLLVSQYFLEQRKRPDELIDFMGKCTSNRTRSFSESVEYFQSIFSEDTVAIIPSAFFMPRGNSLFISRVLVAQPSLKLLSLFRIIRDRIHSSLWDNFIGVHLRFKDMYEFICQTEDPANILGQIQNASISMMEQSGTSRSPPIFFASSSKEANICYKQILRKASIETFDLSDLLTGDASVDGLSEVFHVRMSIILSVLDQIMVSLGKRIIVSGQMRSSTFQDIIRIRNNRGCNNVEGFC